MKKSAKIYVAGHTGLVGSAIWKNLLQKGYTKLLGKTLDELDLRNQSDVERFFDQEKPDYVFLAAAKVGGIVANNTYRADFIYENLQIQNNIIHSAWKFNTKKLLFLGSTCIYPKNAPQPMSEDALLTDVLEYTNEPYAIAKIAGIKLCESFNLQYGTNFLSVMPTNLYGPNDNFNLETSHVLPALLRKMHLAKLLKNGDFTGIRNDLNLRPIPSRASVIAGAEVPEALEGLEATDEKNILDILKKYGVTSKGVEIWGTGKPMREFLWSEDMADACVFVMEKINFNDLIQGKEEIRNCHINIGTGKEISIAELASTIQNIIDYDGQIIYNSQRPDGTMRKLTNPAKLHSLGWKHSVELPDGIRKMYEWYKKNGE
jgi:GDP-L-fucose synthase